MKLAAFDIGTNTVLMLAVELLPEGSVRPILDLARITRIGRGVDRSGELDPEAVRRTIDAIADFAAAARKAGVEKFVGVATSALRDARNGESFIAEVKRRTGLALEVISGRTEAELSHLAVQRGLPIDPAARLLIVDIGGGSTELIRCERGRELALASLQIGSVRLTERIVHGDPPSPADAQRLREEIDRVLNTTGWEFAPDILVAVAGTATTVCAVALGLETYDPARVHGHVLSREEVSRTLARFGELPLAERRRLKGLEEGRADVIFAGTMILDRVMEHFKVPSVVVSDQGVRWGLVWREVERLGVGA